MSDPATVLDFWLHEVGEAGWYGGGAAVDEACRDRFGALWEAAERGGLEHWVDGTAGSLAYLIVTDQFPRNIFRGSARAFATDAPALAAARRAIAAGWDMGAPEPERQFFYLPQMHSEVLADQEECIRLIAARMPATGASNLLHARAHAEVIRRFGRFPYRNAALGRGTTDAEQAFLSGGGYGAIIEALKAAPG
jgi:uncharacterized protein (DUF924 family)